jgi:hypothetical protein
MAAIESQAMTARWHGWICGLVAAAGLAAPCLPQVLSPKVLRSGQPDASDLKAFAQGICARAGARTTRERAEAIWRYFLTDGRFVAPGFWYHIAGWAYEEPRGEVLDPIKLLNSYGFGLCYQVAPLLEAVWEAAGFEDARVWFLTGHTVAEVYYEGAYHHFDSDMMGYTTVGRVPPGRGVVASVAQLELDPGILLGKLKTPREADTQLVADPWYPADVRAGAIGDLSALFTTKDDNHLFPYSRAPRGHAMEFALRPGEKLIRYFAPERPDLFYLPYKWTGRSWEEFPQEVARYGIRTEEGPRSRKDGRTWGTGRFEYRPILTTARQQVFDAASPYVIIDARFEFDLDLPAGESAGVSVSVDEGRTWQAAGWLAGPHRGRWATSPEVLTRSPHGTRTVVGGRYAYQCSITLSAGAKLASALITTRVQLNPRTLPALAAGRNEIVYTAAARQRRELPIASEQAGEWAVRVSAARLVSDGSQGYWIPTGRRPAELTFRVRGRPGSPLQAIIAGGRFLDLRRGVAPDKFTAEIRPAGARPPSAAPSASIAWSTNADGPFMPLWEYEPRLRGLDAGQQRHVLAWPEAEGSAALPPVEEVFVRYSFAGMAVDDFRLAAESKAAGQPCALDVTHIWRQDGVEKRHVERISPNELRRLYAVETLAGAKIEDVALAMECRP